MNKMSTGLVHLYVGDGKGKTTAAMGLAVRALGAGRKVLVVQFLKGQPTSELEPLRRLGVEIVRTEDITKFVFQMDETERAAARTSCVHCLDAAAAALAAGECQLLVLDEVVDAVNCGLISSERLLEVVARREPDVEVVLTGRNPGDDIVEAADYLTVMTALKHPYQRGVMSRKGIEY